MEYVTFFLIFLKEKCRVRISNEVVVLGTETSSSASTLLTLAFIEMHVCVGLLFVSLLAVAAFIFVPVFFAALMPPSLMTRLIGFLWSTRQFHFMQIWVVHARKIGHNSR